MIFKRIVNGGIKSVKERITLKKIILGLTLLLLAISLFQLYAVAVLTSNASSQGTVSFCVNHPPVISSLPNQNATSNLSFTLQVNATDADNHSLYYYDNTTLFEINLTTGRIKFTANNSQAGNYSIQIKVSDYNSACPTNASTIFNLTIISANPLPIFNRTIPNQTWEENVQLTGLDLDDYFYDSQNENLTYSASYGEHVNLSLDNNLSSPSKGTVNITPETNWYGLSWVVFTAYDAINQTANSNNITLSVTSTSCCGDGTCDFNEGCSSCAADCGTCPSSAGMPGIWITPIKKVEPLKTVFQEIVSPFLGKNKFDFSQSGLPFISVTADLKKKANQTKVIISSFGNKTEAVDVSPPGRLYHLGEITIYLDGERAIDAISGAEILFKVEKSWLSMWEIKEEEIVLYHYDYYWAALPTKKEKEDETFIYYTARTAGFSYFAIGTKVSLCDEVTSCEEWSPSSCERGDKQRRRCATIKPDCYPDKQVEEKDCVCQPQWQCSIWLPQECPLEKKQERTCVDLNKCVLDQQEIPNVQECSPPIKEEPSLALAFFRKARLDIRIYWGAITVLLMMIIFYRLRKKIFWRKKDQ